MRIIENILVRLFYFFLWCVLPACQGTTSVKYPTPADYDLGHPIKVDLPLELDEISGIVYYPKDTSVFAESDASGWLYKIYPNRGGVIEKWKFAKGADYEDIQLVDSTFYVLKSNGDILRVKFSTPDSVHTEEFNFPEKGKKEFESLYFDMSHGTLVLVCKDCKTDEHDIVNTWSFNPATSLFGPGPVSLSTNGLFKNDDKKKSQLKPSAAAVNPVTHELFVISSIAKLLIVADSNGVVKASYPLDAALYKQPEGIAFTPAGDLIISNEFANEGHANLLILKRKR